jgi:predicted transcriptional regulator
MIVDGEDEEDRQMAHDRAPNQFPRRAHGELESEILATLWAAGTPLTPSEVRQHVSGDPAYSTVVTTLSRLHEKGTLSRVRSGRAYAYTPIADEAGLAARRMRKVLDAETDRRAVLAQFVSDLSADDERELLRLLGDQRL